MKLFKVLKDGGPESRVTGYFLIEWKQLFSIVLLKFENGTRNAYHSHAFDAVSWVLHGQLTEFETADFVAADHITIYKPSLWPIWTPRRCIHQVSSQGTSWVISFRGSWAKTWGEIKIANDGTPSFHTLTWGRKEVA